jgi:two-component system, cell cycle response regulator
VKVLIVEDDPLTNKVLSTLLKNSDYEVVSMSNGVDALEYLNQDDEPAHLIVADWMMPEMDGLELCKRIRGDKSLPYCFIIILSTRTDDEDIVRGLDAGADDYLLKPYNPDELKARIRAGARILRLHQELESSIQRLRVMASTDGLTSLLNRSAIMNELHIELARAQRDDTYIAVVMADIDHFKKVNDDNGHIAGDHVLVEYSRRLKSGVRTYDAIGRYGGEEFMLIMPNIAENAVKDVVDRLRHDVENNEFKADDKLITVTASFGIAWGHPKEFGSADEFIGVSDSMLYKAKEDGRNAVRFAYVGAESKPTS